MQDWQDQCFCPRVLSSVQNLMHMLIKEVFFGKKYIMKFCYSQYLCISVYVYPYLCISATHKKGIFDSTKTRSSEYHNQMCMQFLCRVCLHWITQYKGHLACSSRSNDMVCGPDYGPGVDVKEAAAQARSLLWVSIPVANALLMTSWSTSSSFNVLAHIPKLESEKDQSQLSLNRKRVRFHIDSRPCHCCVASLGQGSLAYSDMGLAKTGIGWTWNYKLKWLHAACSLSNLRLPGEQQQHTPVIVSGFCILVCMCAFTVHVLNHCSACPWPESVTV